MSKINKSNILHVVSIVFFTGVSLATAFAGQENDADTSISGAQGLKEIKVDSMSEMDSKSEGDSKSGADSKSQVDSGSSLNRNRENIVPKYPHPILAVESALTAYRPNHPGKLTAFLHEIKDLGAKRARGLCLDSKYSDVDAYRTKEANVDILNALVVDEKGGLDPNPKEFKRNNPWVLQKNHGTTIGSVCSAFAGAALSTCAVWASTYAPLISTDQMNSQQGAWSTPGLVGLGGLIGRTLYKRLRQEEIATLAEVQAHLDGNREAGLVAVVTTEPTVANFVFSEVYCK